jgi:hypothetical protein
MEYSNQHGVKSSDKIDPFGVDANFFTCLLFNWFGHSVSLKILRSSKKINQQHLLGFYNKKNI